MNKNGCILLAEHCSIFGSRRISIKYSSNVVGILVNSTVGNISVNCLVCMHQSTVGRISVMCWVSVKCVNLAIESNGISEVLCFFQPIVDGYSVNYQWSVGEVLVKEGRIISELKVITLESRLTIDQLSTHYWPTVDWCIDWLSTYCQLIYQSRLPTINMIQYSEVALDKPLVLCLQSLVL